MPRSHLSFSGWSCLVWLLLLGVPAGHAQSVLPEFTTGQELWPLRVAADVLTTRGPTPDSTRVDCVYRIANDVLVFVKKNGRYRAQYELNLLVHDSDDYQVLGETMRDSVVVSDERDTRLIEASKPQLFSTVLPPGKYTLMLKFLDLESYDNFEVSRKFVVPDYFKKDLAVSDIQFASLIDVDSTTASRNNGGVNVITNLNHVYGERQPEMYIYYEVYSTARADAKKPLEVDYKIKNSTGKVVFTESEDLKRQGEKGVYSHLFHTGGWMHDTYKLDMEVRDKAIKKKARVKGQFNVRLRYLLPLTKKNYKEILKQLRYIAKQGELDEMKKAKTPEEQRAALEAFWRRRDTTPETPINENMLAYYSRIDYANRQFTRGFGKGWESDMGRVYIIYGPPDEVERFTFELDTKPYQLWHYHSSIARTFMFMDFDGFGQYLLYNIY